jgi:hypothetical protein
VTVQHRRNLAHIPQSPGVPLAQILPTLDVQNFRHDLSLNQYCTYRYASALAAAVFQDRTATPANGGGYRFPASTHFAKTPRAAASHQRESRHFARIDRDCNPIRQESMLGNTASTGELSYRGTVRGAGLMN